MTEHVSSHPEFMRNKVTPKLLNCIPLTHRHIYCQYICGTLNSSSANSEIMKHKSKHETKVGNESINDGPVCEGSIKVMSDLMFIVTDFDLECEKVHGKHS